MGLRNVLRLLVFSSLHCWLGYSQYEGQRIKPGTEKSALWTDGRRKSVKTDAIIIIQFNIKVKSFFSLSF